MNLFVRKYVRFCALIMLFLLSLALVGCGEKNVDADPQTELADSAELVLQFPEELENYVIREQSIYGSAVTEAFYIKNGDDAIPLFRVDVGDKNLGDWLGALRTKSGDVPVTYTVFVISEEDMASLGENAQTLYAELMDGFNVMLDGIINDPRFTYEKTIDVGEEGSVSMSYWTVELPDNMWFTERTDAGNYEAIFYTEIRGESVALYEVRIGDVKAETELGLFEINGEKKPISIGSYDLLEMESWEEEDYSTAYRMMDTINHVIDTLMQSKQFSTEAE
ncbi:MAG: hypothetical protein IKW21_00865 [Lachnospiraceae bacterium]|nr:hypothetical protein [Lachnospiraceae bacterium]